MKKIILLFSLAIVTFSCNTDDEIKASEKFNSSPKIVGFEAGNQTASYFTNTGQVLQEFPLNLLGGGDGKVFNEDVFVSYTVSFPVASIPAASTDVLAAQVSTEFNYADTTGKIKIPAGQTFGYYPLLINTGNLNPTKKTRMILTLTAVTGGAVVSENHKTLEIDFVGCQSLVGTVPGNLYTVTINRADGNVYRALNETIRTFGPNTFRTLRTGHWGSSQILPTTAAVAGLPVPDSGYDFTDICGDITIKKDNLARAYSNQVEGTDFYNGNDGRVISSQEFRTRYKITPLGALPTIDFENIYVRL